MVALGSALSEGARWRTAVLVNLAMVVEQANEQVLPAVYLFVGRSLNASPAQLGTLTLCRALVQTLASPLSGLLGDRYDRVTVLSSGAFIWGTMTAAMAETATLQQAMAFAGINGMGLALLVPCCQSLIADLFPAEARGRAFGLMQLTGALGGMAGGVFATNMGGRLVWGLEGWRFAFHVIAAVSILTGAVALTFAVDPRRSPYCALPSTDVTSLVTPPPPASSLSSGKDARERSGVLHSVREAGGGGGGGREEASGVSSALLYHQHSVHIHGKGGGSSTASSSSPAPGGSDVGSGPEEGPEEGDCSGKGRAGRPRRRGVLGDIAWMMRIRTFQAIVLQGIVGCFPWQAMVFFTLWLQLLGFSDVTSSMLVATFGLGVAAGALVGGAVGDRLARWSPNHGRILTAQISVAAGIPLTLLLLKGLPSVPSLNEAPHAYALVMFTMGLTCTWAGAGCNSPIFAEIVPDEMRSTIYAFDRSFEGSIAACAAPVVGLLAERVFGFQGALSEASLRDKTLRRANAIALSSSLASCMVVPWTLCLLFYSLLHLCYAQDKARARLWGGALPGPSPSAGLSRSSVGVYSTEGVGRGGRAASRSSKQQQQQRHFAGDMYHQAAHLEPPAGEEDVHYNVLHLPEDWQDTHSAPDHVLTGQQGRAGAGATWMPGQEASGDQQQQHSSRYGALHLPPHHHHQQQQQLEQRQQQSHGARQARLEEFYGRQQHQQPTVVSTSSRGGGSSSSARKTAHRSAWQL